MLETRYREGGYDLYRDGKKVWDSERERKTLWKTDNRKWYECFPGSPFFYIPDHRDHGLALRCNYPSLPTESSTEYWNRVRKEIELKFWK